VLLTAFEAAYHRLYERIIPNLEVEILTWVLLVSTELAPPAALGADADATEPVALTAPSGQRQLVDTATGGQVEAPVYARETLKPGMRLTGPAIILEQDTTTVVSARFSARIHALGYIILERHEMPQWRD
jgi:N-methylhydantoinase A